MTDARTLLAACLLLSLARGVQAQAPAPQPAGCTYATCALRVEPGFWGPRLVRGAASEEVGGRLTGFGGGVDPLLAGPDSAAFHARTYVQRTRTAGTLGLVALAGYVVVLWQTDNFRRGEDLNAAGTVAALAGTGAGIAAGVYGLRASRALSRSIWWYNAALPR
jgi:hypothetical protein